MSNVKFYNVDCMEHMASVPDKYYDLAIVDPPYGIGEDGKSNHSRSKLAKSKEYAPKKWDNQIPSPEYFLEANRICKNVIIWGANHFIENIPNANSSCWIIWDKDNGENDFADCEIAYTTFKTAIRKFKFRWHGMLQGNMKQKEERIHPTQKPVALYKWLLTHYAKAGDKIFDSHGGSMSSAIACNDLHFDLDICELDKDYFDVGVKRFNNHIAQTTLF